MGGYNNFMANQINYIHKEAVVEMSIVDNDIEIIGCVKAEITEKIALIHPFMYKPTKTNFLLLKKVFNKVVNRMKKYYDFYAVHAYTNNTKFVNMLTNKKAYPIGISKKGILYEYEIV